MAKIPFKLRFETFHLNRQVDSGRDQPYIVPLYCHVDGVALDVTKPLSLRRIHATIPAGTGHGDLGPAAKDVTAPRQLTVPRAIGEYQATIDTTGLPDGVWDAFRVLSVIAAVAFFEEESTLDSSVERLIPEVQEKVQTAIDALLLKLGGPEHVPLTGLPGTGKPTGTSAFPQQQASAQLDPTAMPIRNLVEDAREDILAEEIGKAIGVGFGVAQFVAPLPVGTLVSVGLNVGVQADDPDVFVDRDAVQLNVARLIAAGGRISFELGRPSISAFERRDARPPGFNQEPQPPRYRITGWAVRTDVDEPPVISAITAGDTIHLFGRTVVGDRPLRWRSADFGRAFTAASFAPSGTVALTGIGAGANANGTVQVVVTRVAEDERRIALLASSDGGTNWRNHLGTAATARWGFIPEVGDFTSTPAVGVNPEGSSLYVVTRDESNRCLYTFSNDGGHTWAPYARVGHSTITSSPALAVMQVQRPRQLPENRVIVVARGLDKNLQIVHWSAGNSPESANWEPLPVDNVTSAPTLTISPDGGLLICTVRDSRNLYIRGESNNNGESFGVWATLGAEGSPSMGAAPAMLFNQAGDIRCVLGLNMRLQPWRMWYRAGGEAGNWRAAPLSSPLPPSFFY